MGVWRGLRMLLFLMVAAVLALVLGFVVHPLWNWLVPGIFGLHAITYWQAVGLLVLCKLLFGGLHPRGGGGRGGQRWKRKMGERWAGMSDEERERFRAGMRGRRGCGFGRGDARTEAEGTR